MAPSTKIIINHDNYQPDKRWLRPLFFEKEGAQRDLPDENGMIPKLTQKRRKVHDQLLFIMAGPLEFRSLVMNNASNVLMLLYTVYLLTSLS